MINEVFTRAVSLLSDCSSLDGVHVISEMLGVHPDNMYRDGVIEIYPATDCTIEEEYQGENCIRVRHHVIFRVISKRKTQQGSRAEVWRLMGIAKQALSLLLEDAHLPKVVIESLRFDRERLRFSSGGMGEELNIAIIDSGFTIKEYVRHANIL